MRGLVLFEVCNLDIGEAAHFIPENEASICQLIEQRIYVTVVIRQYFDFYPLRSVLKPAFTIRPTPKPLKEEAP